MDCCRGTASKGAKYRLRVWALVTVQGIKVRLRHREVLGVGCGQCEAMVESGGGDEGVGERELDALMGVLVDQAAARSATLSRSKLGCRLSNSLSLFLDSLIILSSSQRSDAKCYKCYNSRGTTANIGRKRMTSRPPVRWRCALWGTSPFAVVVTTASSLHHQGEESRCALGWLTPYQ